MTGDALRRLLVREWVLSEYDLGLPGRPGRHGQVTGGTQPDRVGGHQGSFVFGVRGVGTMAHFTLYRAV